MDRLEFANLLRQAVLSEWEEYTRAHASDSAYAFALIGGQVGCYLGYAIASEEGLQRVAADYDASGYRYQGWDWETFDNREKLSSWLRWANPDDGWQYGEFSEDSRVKDGLASLVQACALGEEADELEEYCTDILASLQREPAWQPWSNSVVIGFTSGEDPRDFLRTATRANPYSLVKKLWSEFGQCEELSNRILATKS